MTRLSPTELEDFRRLMKRAVECNQLQLTGRGGNMKIMTDKIRIIDEDGLKFIELNLQERAARYSGQWDR